MYGQTEGSFIKGKTKEGGSRNRIYVPMYLQYFGFWVYFPGSFDRVENHKRKKAENHIKKKIKK